MSYYLSGIHCLECARKIENRIQKIDGQASLDYKNMELNLGSQANLDQVKTILDMEKVLYVDEINEVHDHEQEEEGHSHGHSHSHDLSEKNTRIVFFLNAIFAFIELIFGNLFNSQAILSDSIHDAGDAVSIGIAWLFEKMSTKEANQSFTFGYQRFSLLGVVITSVVLIVGSVFIVLESIPKIINPVPVNYRGMIYLAIIALVVKLVAMYLMKNGYSKNEKMLSLHMLEDILGWAAVLLASAVISLTGWYVLDPILSLGIGCFILSQAVPPFLETIQILLDASPQNVDLAHVKEAILKIENVKNFSHLHIWSIDGQENAMNLTVLTDSNDVNRQEDIKEEIRTIVFPYEISHSTIEIVYHEGQA